MIPSNIWFIAFQRAGHADCEGPGRFGLLGISVVESREENTPRPGLYVGNQGLLRCFPILFLVKVLGTSPCFFWGGEISDVFFFS